jgi:hypothetical protein
MAMNSTLIFTGGIAGGDRRRCLQIRNFILHLFVGGKVIVKILEAHAETVQEDNKGKENNGQGQQGSFLEAQTRAVLRFSPTHESTAEAQSNAAQDRHADRVKNGKRQKQWHPQKEPASMDILILMVG